MRSQTFLLATLLLVITGQTSSAETRASASPETRARFTRPYAMGFTPFPCSSQPVNGVMPTDIAWSYIRDYGDMAVIHEDGGVPWTEAYHKQYDAYHPAYKAEIQYIAGKRNALPRSHKVFLYLSLLDFSRTKLARYRGATTAMDLPEPWKSLENELSHEAVLTAFINHADYLIAQYRPDFFAFGTEVNILLNHVAAGTAPQDAWSKLAMASRVLYQYFKTRYPNMYVFYSIQAESFYDQELIQRTWLPPILPYTDLIAVSSYPYLKYTAGGIPSNYYAKLADLDRSKRFAFAEVGWPGEPLYFPDHVSSGQPYDYFISSSQPNQTTFVARLLSEAQYRNALFINWYISRDYDLMWEQILKTMPNAALLKLWKEDGLFDGAGAPRQAAWHWYFTKLLRKRAY